MGRSVPLQSLFWWLAEKMCTHSRRNENHWEMSCGTLWWTLWCIPYSGQDMAKWILLANHVRGHQRLHPKMPKMPAPWRNHRKRCNAPTEQPLGRIIWRLGHWLHGTIPKVLWHRIHPGGSWLCVQMGRSSGMPCDRLQACSTDVPRDHISLFWDTKDGDKWRRVSLHW